MTTIDLLPIAVRAGGTGRLSPLPSSRIPSVSRYEDAQSLSKGRLRDDPQDGLKLIVIIHEGRPPPGKGIYLADPHPAVTKPRDVFACIVASTMVDGSFLVGWGLDGGTWTGRAVAQNFEKVTLAAACPPHEPLVLAPSTGGAFLCAGGA